MAKAASVVTPARKADYEDASAKRLAAQPAKARPRPFDSRSIMDWLKLKQHLEARLSYLRLVRYSWAYHWSTLETFILPRRGIFINAAMPTANNLGRGQAVNQNIVDPTGTYAMRRCAAGMMSGLMSPSRPWFKIKPKPLRD